MAETKKENPPRIVGHVNAPIERGSEEKRLYGAGEEKELAEVCDQDRLKALVQSGLVCKGDWSKLIAKAPKPAPATK